MNHRKIPFHRTVRIIVFFVLCVANVSALAAPVKNIVLVHGAWADGSGWKGVYDVPGASHSVYVSKPKEVAALIEEAAAHAK